MAYTLTSADLDLLGEAVRILASPFDHDGVDGWRSAVLDQLRPLLGADSAGFLLPAPDALPFYSNTQDLDELNRYPEVPPPPPVDGIPGLVRAAQLDVATLAMVYGEELPTYYGSVHYNEHAAPHHSHDTLMANVIMDTPMEGAVPGLSSLHFWHERPTGPTFGDREVALLRVVYPAFQAGVQSIVRWGHQRESLLDTFDGLDQAAAVANMDGRVVHVTPALEALLEAESDAAVLRTALRAALQAAGDAQRGDGVGAPFERSVRTRSAGYTLRACLYGGHIGAPLAVVSVERAAAALPSADAVAAAFGLTDRQAEVALLLAERMTNREIAEALFVSPHTARHHTEAVLRALGLNNRRDVRDRIVAAGAQPLLLRP